MANPFGGPRTPENEDTAMQRPATRDEWERLPSDPDLREDLGYELLDLEAHETQDGHLLFLPRDEDMIREEAFIVVCKDVVTSFGE